MEGDELKWPARVPVFCVGVDFFTFFCFNGNFLNFVYFYVVRVEFEEVKFMIKSIINDSFSKHLGYVEYWMFS